MSNSNNSNNSNTTASNLSGLDAFPRGSIWSIAKGDPNDLWMVESYKAGWFAVAIIDQSWSGAIPGDDAERVKIRAADFGLRHHNDPDTGLWAAVWPSMAPAADPAPMADPAPADVSLAKDGAPEGHPKDTDPVGQQVERPVAKATKPYALVLTYSDMAPGDSKRREFSNLRSLARAYEHAVGRTDDGVSYDGVAVARPIGASIEEILAELDSIENSPGRAMSRQLHDAANSYVTAKNASGTTTKHTGDALAHALLRLLPWEVSRLASALLDKDEDLYDHLNPGQVRMNWGNRLRAAIRRGDLDEDAVVRCALDMASPAGKDVTSA